MKRLFGLIFKRQAKGRVASFRIRARNIASLSMTGLFVLAFLIGGGIFAFIPKSPSASALVSTVPSGGPQPTSTPAAGDEWDLTDNMTLTANVTLPAGGTLIIKGAAGGSTINLNGFRFISTTTAGQAYTLEIQGGDVTFTGGSTPAATPGGVIGITGATSSFTLNNNATGTLSFTGNTATTTGGVISTTGAVMINGDITLNNNTATTNGGVIFAGSATGSTGVATGNAIYINGSLSADNNRATSGAGGALYATTGHITVTNSTTLTNNVSIGNGGAIFAAGNATSTVNLATATGNAVITGNISRASGGAIYAGATSVSLTTVTIGNASGSVNIENNCAGYTRSATTPYTCVTTTAATGGGAISMGGAVVISGTAVTLSGNQSRSNGGGIFASNGLTVNGNLTANNNVNTIISGANPNNNGGGCYYGSGMTVNGNFTANNNSTDGSGGCVFSSSGLTVNGSLLANGNRAGLIGSGRSGGFMGSATGSTSNVVVTGSVTLTNNIAYSWGGGIYAGSGQVKFAATSGNDVTISGNMVTGSGGNQYGGAIYANSFSIGSSSTPAGTVTISNNFSGFILNDPNYTGDITANDVHRTSGVPDTGSVIHAGGGVTIYATTTTANDNQSGGGHGAVIYSLGTVIIDGGNISMDGNRSAVANPGNGIGGAISGGNIFLANTTGDVTLTNNSTSGYGGAIYATTSITLGNSGSTVTVSGNQADCTYDAGYIYVCGGGGLHAGLYDGSGYVAGGDITITGQTITMDNNNATLGMGGGIYAVNNVTITPGGGNLTMSGNAADYGGGIYAGGTVDITGGTFTNNVATYDGGAIFAGTDLGGGFLVSYPTFLTIDAPATFSGNTAGNGPSATDPGDCFGYNTNIHASAFSDLTFPAPIGTVTPNGICSTTSGGLTAYNNYDIAYNYNGLLTPEVVTFELNGGDFPSSVVNPQFFTTGYSYTVVKPVDPTFAGLMFGGWYADSGLTTPYVFGTISAGATIYAKWKSAEASLTLSSPTFTPLDGSTVNIAASASGLRGNVVPINVETDSATGYNFSIGGTTTNSDDTNQLVSTTTSSTFTAVGASFPSATTLSADNTWGYATDFSDGTGTNTIANTFDTSYSPLTPAGTSKWAAMPTTGNSDLIRQTNSATPLSGDDFNIYYAVKTGGAQPIGTYSRYVVYTAVANP